MPLLQLQIDIDSDVHPELHAMLALVARAPARAERLRQLAATGLIWEQLRAQARSSPLAAGGSGIEPTPISASAGEPRPADGASRTAPRGDIPVLTDVIDEATLPLPAHAADADADAALDLASDWDLVGVDRKHDRPEPAPTPVRQRAVRPRLQKMREKGLFRNGPDG